MTNQHAIVLAVDGSEASSAAARWAAREARLRQCDIFVVHVCDVETTSLWPVPSLDAEVRASARPIVDAAIDIVKAAEPEVPVRGQVLLGGPARTFVELSKRSQLIVLGRSGRGALADHLVGSLPKRLAAHAKCPIVAVPKDVELAGLESRIVVGVGYHLTEERATEFAVAEGSRRPGVAVLAVRAWHGPNGLPLDPAAPPQNPMYGEDLERAGLRARLNEKLGDGGPTPEVVVRAGQPGGVLASMCTTADLLVVGQHQREAFLPPRAGRVVSDCLHLAPCAVAVVPDPIEARADEPPRVPETVGFLGY